MPGLKDISTSRLIMRLAQGGIVLLLLAAMAVSWNFNITHTGWWFARAIVFLVLALVLLWRQCVHIRDTRLRIGIAVVVTAILALFVVGRMVSFYYQGESYNEEFFFHFNLETARFAIGAFPGLLLLSAGYMVVAGILAGLSAWHLKTEAVENRTLLIVPMALVLVLLEPDMSRWAISSMRISNTQDALSLTNIDWDATGLNREALFKMRDEITAGKNVVIVYLEGLERMYTQPEVFPGLTPFLTRAAQTGLTFTDMQQTRGTTFTVAGILSSQCGTPLLFPQGPGGNDILKNGFLQEGFCLGDILDTAGYRQVFMGGASTRFAGKGLFLSAHGYREVLGKEELEPLMDDPAYLNNWGLYDDTLLDLAADKFDELAANTDRPFNFTVLTVDTHPPDGTVSKSCEPYARIDNNIFHAVHCTDQLVEKFVTHLQQSPAWDDTVVLLMSDHLHMRNTGMDYYPPEFERRLYATILNGDRTGSVDIPSVHMDIAPTLLGMMGVQHQQGFLAGRNLLQPDAQDLWVDPEDSSRLSAIRYINTNLLSRIEVGLCEAEPLYSMQGGILSVAGRELDLSMGGRPLPMEVLESSDALVTLVSREGRVGLTFPVALHNLAYVLFQFRTQNFLLMLTSDMAQRLAPGASGLSGLNVLFGNMQDGFQVLQSGLSVREDFSVQHDCGDLLDRSRDLRDIINFEALGNICENVVPEGNTWDQDNGVMTLSSVAYADSRFRATFQRNGRGWYTVTGLAELPPERPPEACDAYYGSMEVLIPGMQTVDGPVSMILQKVPGITLTFELGTITPLPQ